MVRIVFHNFLCQTSLSIVANGGDTYLLGLNSNCVVRVKLSEVYLDALQDNGYPLDVSEDQSHQELESQHPLHCLFSHEQQIYTLDILCNLYLLGPELSCAMDVNSEEDLFGNGSEDDSEWNLVFKCRLLSERKVVAFNKSSKNIFLLTQDDNWNLFFNSVSLDTFEVSLPLTFPSNNCTSGRCIYVPLENLPLDFLNMWITPRSPSDIVFIGLDNGLIFALHLKSSTLEFIYDALEEVMFLGWFKNEKLIVVLKGSGVIELSANGHDLWHIPLFQIQPHLITSSYLLVSDQSVDLYALHLDSRQLTPAPIKFATSGVVWSDSCLVFGSNHGTVYSFTVPLEHPKGTIEYLNGNTNLLSILVESTNSFQSVSNHIAQEDRLIEAISLMTRQDDIQFQIIPCLHSVSGISYVFTVRVFVKTPYVKFSKDVWALNISLNWINGQYNVTHHLLDDFLCDSPIQHLVEFKIKSPLLNLTLSTRLVYSADVSRFKPIISLGKVDLDASYFIEPVTSLSMRLDRQDNEQALMKLFKGTSLPTFASSPFSKELVLTVQISPDESTLKTVLNNSKGLWRASQWENIGSLSEVEVVVMGRLIKLCVGAEGVLKVKGKCPIACHMLKSALVSCLKLTSPILIDYSTLIQLEDQLQSIEISRFEGGVSDHSALSTVFDLIRSCTTHKLDLLPPTASSCK